MVRAFTAAALTATLLACPAPDTRAPVPPAPAEVTPDQQPDPGATWNGDRRAPVQLARATGAACERGADCDSGICEGWGCGPEQGTCAPEARGCTRDLRAYCGCDGMTFQSSGSCPGSRYAYRGACAAPRADGAACASDLQCRSGVCEGKGCGPDETGVCVATGRMCTSDVQTYCGCHGNTFTASGSCPGRRYANRGSCELR